MGATNPNLLCHMKFEAIKAGKVPDASGRGHDATVVGSPKIVPDARLRELHRAARACRIAST